MVVCLSYRERDLRHWRGGYHYNGSVTVDFLNWDVSDSFSVTGRDSVDHTSITTERSPEWVIERNEDLDITLSSESNKDFHSVFHTGNFSI